MLSQTELKAGRSDKRSLSRRGFLAGASRGGAALLSAGYLGMGDWCERGVAAELRAASSALRITNIERQTVKVPYREIPKRAMDREHVHWQYSEVFEVHTQGGASGFGETLLFYTWGATDDDDVRRATGRNAAELMWDDSLGAGLQMALFDVVGRTLGLPVHALLGHQVSEKTPLSWWNIDMGGADMAAECSEAMRHGYTAYKTKGRPWFDVRQAAKAVAKAVPESFKLDLDFNSTLVNAERGLPILKDLEKYAQIDICETPIPQEDIPGNKEIRENTRFKIAMHYGNPAPKVAISQGICDGFVIGGGTSRIMEQGHVAAMADMPFWLQMVGTGITAAFSLHFGAVLSHATWPAVNCHQLFVHDMLTERIEVSEGFAKVPTGPGLGYDVDMDAVKKYATRKPPRRPDPERLIETRWADGRRLYVANTGEVIFMFRAAMDGKIPYYEGGADTRLLPNDGSSRWRELYEQARKQPVMK